MALVIFTMRRYICGTRTEEENAMTLTLASTQTFPIGIRVQAHPATDAWMMGDRYGNVVKLGRKYISVAMDRSGKVRRFSPSLLLVVR